MPYSVNEGVHIHYQVIGEGTPIILLHGLFASWGDWHEAGYVAALKDRYQLLLVDARGHGASDKPHESDAYALHHLIGDLTSVLDAANVQQAHFLGYSWGGCIGYGIGKYAPERFLSVMLGGHAPVGGDAATVDYFTQPLQAGIDAFASMLDQIFDPAQAGYKARRLSGDFDAYKAVVIAWRNYSGFDDLLNNMSIPSLLYIGDADGGYAELKANAPHIPLSKLVVLPGLDHAQALMRSDLICPHLVAFMEEVSQT